VTGGFDTTGFRQAVERHWRHHAPGNRLDWKAGDGGTRFDVAPSLRKIDGQRVWSGFDFDLGGFLAEPGVASAAIRVGSYCGECAETPTLDIGGTYRGTPFRLVVHLEPIRGRPP
jgi:hypothetical protein